MSLLIGAASIVLVLLLVVPVIAVTALTLGIGLLCILPLICIMIPVFWMVGILIEQATVAIVVEDLGVFDSIKRAWQIVVQENLGSYAVLGLILGIGGAIVGFIFALPHVPDDHPHRACPRCRRRKRHWRRDHCLHCHVPLYLPILIVLSGVLQAYIGSAWTLAFRRAASASLEEPKDFDGDLELLSSETPNSVGKIPSYRNNIILPQCGRIFCYTNIKYFSSGDSINPLWVVYINYHKQSSTNSHPYLHGYSIPRL